MADIKKVSTHFLLMDFYLMNFCYSDTISQRYWNIVRDELKKRKEEDGKKFRSNTKS